ncbi:MAG: DUF2199 domain-containing protein [Micropruina sp.]|nr:MAG: DUF2199 domain-containing protein [Micropruina sp.]
MAPGVATIFGPHVPEAWRHATPLERAGGLIGPELCSVTIEGARHHFVRGHLELPVDDEQLDPFTWSVWVEVTEADLRRLVEHWDDQDREDAVGVLAGRLATELPYPRRRWAWRSNWCPGHPARCPWCGCARTSRTSSSTSSRKASPCTGSRSSTGSCWIRAVRAAWSTGQPRPVPL